MTDRKTKHRDPCVLERLEARLLLDGAASALEALDPAAGGLSAPPPGYEYDPPDEALSAAGTARLLSSVPEYFWYHGCGPTAVGMVLGYWDSLAYPDFFTGDASTQTSAVDDGIASAGHILDWVPSPDRQPPPDYHTDDCIADFFKTSRAQEHGWSKIEYADDAFSKYSDMVGYGAGEAFTIPFGLPPAAGVVLWEYLRLNIDAGRPAMFLVDLDGDGDTEHYVPVIGYRTEPQQQWAAYTTWPEDPGVHWFNWNGAHDNVWGIKYGTFFIPAGSYPDLAGTHADVVDRTALLWGDSFTYDYRIKNYGGGDAGGFRVRFFLSNDPDIGVGGDVELDNTYISSLPDGAVVRGSRNLTLPASPPAGFTWEDTVYIGMVTDTANEVGEGSEGNNRNLGIGKDYDQVRVSGEPDLVGTGFSLDFGVLNGGEVEATFTVTNASRAPTVRNFYVDFYLSKNTTVSTIDTFLERQWVAALQPGESYTGTVDLEPGSTDPFGGNGTYTIGMVIDATGTVNEADETNNRNVGFGLDKAEATYGRKIFFADFEHGDGAMDVDNDTPDVPVDGLWHTETHRASDAGHSGPNSLYYGRKDPVEGDWEYDVGDSAGVFTTKRIELPDKPILLTFNYFADVEASLFFDKMYVQVYDPEIGAYAYVLEKGAGLVANTEGNWHQAAVDLGAFRGKNVRLRFGFDSINALFNDHEGWYVDDIAVWSARNAVTVEAFRSLMRDSDYTHEASYVHWAGDHDTFVFNEEQYDGSFVISTDRQGSQVNPAVAVYDYATREMLYIDSDSGSGSEARISLPNSGNWNSYLVEVWDTEEDSTGELDVSIDGTGLSGYGNLAFDDAGDASVTGTIDSDNDTDYFRLVAPAQASGTLTVTVNETSGDVRTRMQVWAEDGDDKPEAVRFNENGLEEATLTGVQPGEAFWVSVSDHDFAGTGDFQLDVDFSTALPGELTSAEGFAAFHRDGTADDSLSFGAYMNQAGDVDSYTFAGDTGWTGTYTLTADAAGSDVDPVLAVYDAATGEQLAFDDDSGKGNAARVSLTLDELTRYIVAVADATGTQTGNIDILITTPHTGFTTEIGLDADGDGSRTGQVLNHVEDTDFYRLTAPADTNGDLTVRVVPVTASLDTAVTAFDVSGHPIGQAFAAGAGSQDVLTLTGLMPGGQYFLSVLSRNYATSGTFEVHADFGLALPTAIDPAVEADFAWSRVNQFGDQTGLHPFGAGDPSVMEIRPERTGPIVLEMSCDTVDDMVLGLYDASGSRVAFDIATGGATASINHAGSAATIYYIYSSSLSPAQSGNYDLDIDAPGFPISTALTVDPGTGAGSYTSAQVSPRSDQDYFYLDAPLHAKSLTVTMTPDAGSTLKPFVRLYDAAGVRLAADDAASGAAQFTYTNVTPGHTYVLGAGGNWYSSGRYDLTVQFDLYDVPLTAPPLEYYGPLSVRGDRDITEVHINFTSDRDSWRFASRSGGATTFTATAAAGINPLLVLYDAAGNMLAMAENSSGTTETLTYSLGARAIYTILVQDAERDAIGNVDVAIDAPTASYSTLALDEAGRGSSRGQLAYGTDPTRAETDYHVLTAPDNALGPLALTVDPDAAFRLEFQLFDSSGDPVGSRYGSPADGQPASHIYPSLTPGETYHACVFAYRFADHPSGGGYTVEADFDLALQVVSWSVPDGGFVPPTGMTVTARFNEQAQAPIEAGDFKLSGAVIGGVVPDAWSYDAGDSSLAITYPALPPDTYTLRLYDSITDTSGRPLDGDFDLTFRPTIPGDADCDGEVDHDDYELSRDGFGLVGAATWRKGDYDGNTNTDHLDYLALKRNFGSAVTGTVVPLSDAAGVAGDDLLLHVSAELGEVRAERRHADDEVGMGSGVGPGRPERLGVRNDDLELHAAHLHEARRQGLQSLDALPAADARPRELDVTRVARRPVVGVVQSRDRSQQRRRPEAVGALAGAHPVDQRRALPAFIRRGRGVPAGLCAALTWPGAARGTTASAVQVLPEGPGGDGVDAAGQIVDLLLVPPKWQHSPA